MPHQVISIEDVLCKTKDRKSSKKCCPKKCSPKKHCPKKDACDVECCITDCNTDCCTAAFQRLDKLRMNWLLVQQSSLDAPTSVFTRNSQEVNVDGSGSYLPLEATAAGFVNTVRYLGYEECGKLDQVTGWSVNVQTGDLYFYQNLPDLGLSTTDSRATLLNIVSEELTPSQRKQLNVMEPFWKLALKAVDRVRENPKTEGNICEIKDKCGNKFLVAINRTNDQENLSACDYNPSYSVVT